MDPLIVGNIQRFFSRNRPAQPETRPARPAASSGESYAAILRERELHRMILVEMERRGPEVTAEELYDELAARWDREHATADATASAEAPAEPGGAEPRSGDGGGALGRGAADEPPAWAAELIEEQRETNRLLRRLLERLAGDESPRPLE